jgi:hypothetical protein
LAAEPDGREKPPTTDGSASVDRVAEDEAPAMRPTRVDFNGRYGLEVEDPDVLPALYERVLAGLPEALVEDRTTCPRSRRCSNRTPTASPTTRRSTPSPTSTPSP